VKGRDKRVPVTSWRVLRLRVEDRPSILRVAANILNKQLRTADRVWSYSFGVGRGADNSKTYQVTKRILAPRAWTDSLVRPKHWKKDMRSGTRNVMAQA